MCVLAAGEVHLLRRLAPGVFDHALDEALTEELLADPRQDLGVAPGHRRRGLARRLFHAPRAVAGELGCGELWLATEAGNLPACQLHETPRGEAEPAVLYSFRPRD